MGRFVIVCGGTGGHLAPGVAMAQELTARGHTCTLILSEKEVDSRLVKKYPEFPVVRSPGSGFSMRPRGFVRFLSGVLRAIFFALRWYRDERPDAVLAFGGFLATAYVLAASSHDIPIFLHEANRKPGKAIRFLARFADRVYLPHDVSLRALWMFGAKHIGFPIRRDVRHLPKEMVRQSLGFPRHAKLLVVFGGSQGAVVLNEWAEQHLESLTSDGIHLIVITGPGKGEEVSHTRVSESGEAVTARFLPFADYMGSLLSAADLVVSRAGAGSIAEITECLAPAVLIPYPYSADQHQQENAAYLERKGGCLLLPQSDMKGLYREVLDLIFNDWLLSRMRGNLRALQRGNEAAHIADDMERILIRLRGEREAPESLSREEEEAEVRA
ncbi:MAG: UDP-N-acetylglucosamine--N-acetylmuramyl-(pentapeptide) pyrophosphoryl-undecaprenol N-acetylglucosamine transferase [Opitutales bacterium]|nr:UDP-N-acetylglucosamine--N-acetylmuramyl-(pentapeptide) pyrophosphoryl-undecaprenol N-acetylglucosamine transferase [Opitutales bacterium]